MQTERQISEIESFLQKCDKVEIFLTVKAREAKSPIASLTTAQEIQRFLSGIRFEPKPDCPCRHDRNILFWRGTKALNVDFCSHCFYVRDRANVLNRTDKMMGLQMPKALYERIVDLIKMNQGSEQVGRESRETVRLHGLSPATFAGRPPLDVMTL